jgi:hypothetical protein
MTEKRELATGRCVNGGGFEPLRRSRLAFELDQGVECNRDRFHCRMSMPNRQSFRKTKAAG